MKRLPLSLFEEYLLQEDRPAHPCWIFIRLRLKGVLRRGEFQEAVDHMVERHPLLACVVRHRWTGRAEWVHQAGFRPVVRWVKGPLANGWPDWEPINLADEPGFRIVVVDDATGEATNDVILQAHHALFDAAGAAAVFHDIFLGYARRLGRTVDMPEVRAEALQGRDRFELTLRELPGQLIGLLVCLRLQLRKAAPIIPHVAAPDAGPLPDGLPAIVRRQISAGEFGKVRGAAKRLGVRVNDLLIRDFQAAIGAWRQAEGRNDPEDWIRLTVPVNLRTRSDRFLPATNRVGAVVLDRQARSLADRKRLLRRVCEDMGSIKDYKLGYTFWILLSMCRLWPGGIGRYLRSREILSSAMFSSIGQILPRSPLLNRDNRFEVPGAVIEDITMVGPCRPGCCVTLETAFYADSFWVDMHYDSRVLTAAQSEGLMQAFLDQIRLSVENL